MKKLIAAILTAFLMSLGLVATSSPSATAAPPQNCPYGGCFATSTSAIGLKTKAPRKAKVFVKVSSFGNGKPKGSVVFTFVRPNGKSFTFTRPYPKQGKGRAGVFNFRPLPPGKYNVIVTFNPNDNSSFEGSSDTTKVKVHKKKRRR